MVLCLFQRLYSTKRYPGLMCLHHDPFANPKFEFKNSLQGLYHVLHGIVIVIMKQHLIQRDVKRVLFSICSRL